MTATEQRLIELAAATFSVSATGLTADADMFEALGIDSLKALELLSEVELEFDVQIPDYELRGVTTFRALAAKIDERR
ncbi:MAG: acyl carrier protein [Myxococcales bacterium]|nr:acyl carrier protein [Myxococcales bacterium]MCB9520262.1 acyl carrier protein [Myxococcales bacterium]MCB9531370.1 acyl carrier protein [Myxococcales bacterium]MCB9533557.1 acyl carrier protein [Myxococcales bacterium]